MVNMGHKVVHMGQKWCIQDRKIKTSLFRFPAMLPSLNHVSEVVLAIMTTSIKVRVRVRLWNDVIFTKYYILETNVG